MADVFISYKSERRAAAKHLADVLKANGYTVWFDYELIKGEGFRLKLDAELRRAKAVVVLWCAMSVESEWVDKEAGLADQLRTLVPAKIEDCQVKVAYHGADTIDLRAWDGAPRSHVLDPLLRAVARLVQRPPHANWEALAAIDETWRHYGAPTLARFALGKGVEVAPASAAAPSAGPGLGGAGHSDHMGSARGRPTVPLGWMAASAVGALALGYVGAYFAGVPVWWPARVSASAGLTPAATSGAVKVSEPEGPKPPLTRPSADEAERQRVAALETRIRDQDAALAKVEAERKQQADLAAQAKRDKEAQQKAEEDVTAKRKAEEERTRSGISDLAVKKNTLIDELSRLKSERPSLAADLAEKKTELDNRAKGVDAKRIEAQAEDRGAEGTLKQGKGPLYRQIMADLARLQEAYKIQESRVRDSQQRLEAASNRIAQLERELAAVESDLGKLRGEPAERRKVEPNAMPR